jgi:hypothetical protein
MSEQFVCWEPANEEEPGDNPASRNVVEAFGVEWAAEEYAEKEWWNTDPYEETTIHVRDTQGKVYVVKIMVEYEPTFSGSVQP